MSMIKIKPKKYNDGRTKQSFEDSTNINKILNKAQITGGLSHAMKYDAPVYGEFENYDLLEAHTRVEKAKTIFADLGSEVRREFKQDPYAFMAYASDPQNVGRLAELLPALAEPGGYFPAPVRTAVAQPIAPTGDPPGEVDIVAPAVSEAPAGGVS